MPLKNQEAFLRELSELSRKYGIAIDGCGCCGSPWLYDADGEDFSKQVYSVREKNSDYLEFKEPNEALQKT